jgi:hypothetical protein
MTDTKCLYLVRLQEGPRCAKHFPVPLNLALVDYVRTKIGRRAGAGCYVEHSYGSSAECFDITVATWGWLVHPPHQIAKIYQAAYDLLIEAEAAMGKDDFELVCRQP